MVVSYIVLDEDWVDDEYLKYGNGVYTAFS
jgi:hypothetical protein